MALTGDALAAALDAEMGGNSEAVGISQYLDTGIPELNFALSGRYDGGAPVGRLIEIFGGASCGKTFLATMIMIACQKKGGIAFFSDHERSFEPVLAQSLGLDTSPDKFRYKRTETVEEALDTACKMAMIIRQKGLIPDDAPLVYVIDSIASAVPHQKLYDDKGNRREVGDFKMNDSLALAKSLSQSLPSVVQMTGDNNMMVLALNQIRMKPGVMYGDPLTTPGGNAMEFYASTRLSLGKSEITNGKKGKEKEVFGFQINAKTTKNKVARPFINSSWQVRFNVEGLGVSIDQVATNLDFLIRKGIIKKNGAWMEFEGKKWQQGPLEKELRSDPNGNARLLAMMPSGEDELEDVQSTDIDDALANLD